MRTRHRSPSLGLFSLLFLLLGTAFASAGSPSGASSMPVDVAIRGYDPVAYFTIGKPTPGQPSLAASHGKKTYFFATATNRDAFLRSPAIYAPQYDGHCAMGVADSAIVEGDPLLWRIIDGRLYLNVGVEAARRWRGDIPGNIAAADQAWSAMGAKGPGKL